MTTDEQNLQFFRQIFGAAWISQGISVAAELGIADQLSGGPKSAEELAGKTRTLAGPLYRLLRALASVGIFAEDEHGRFLLTPLAELLRSDAAFTQRAFATMMGAEFHQTWGELLHSVRTGEPGFNKRYGMPFFEYMTGNPARHEIYDAAMMAVHGGETAPVLDAYDFGAFGTVADIGGGNGSALAALLGRHPAAKGILFDLPAVVDRARSAMADLGLSERCSIEGGDFFTAVPANADCYMMRHIIHDWQDSEAVTILRRCQEAMATDGRILVIEMVVPPGNEPGFAKWLDLMMLLVAGRERTEADYRRLFSEARLKLNRVIPTASEVSIIEGVRAS